MTETDMYGHLHDWGLRRNHHHGWVSYLYSHLHDWGLRWNHHHSWVSYLCTAFAWLRPEVESSSWLNIISVCSHLHDWGLRWNHHHGWISYLCTVICMTEACGGIIIMAENHICVQSSAWLRPEVESSSWLSIIVSVCVRLICPSVVEWMTNNCLLTVNPLYFLKHRLYTLSPSTSASHFASVQRREAI
jgi:hypothetical protein